LLLLPDLLPREQLTVAVEVPAPVDAPIFQVQLTVPVASAVGFGFRPAAVEMVPEWYLTDIRQTAPGDVTATKVAFSLGVTDAGRLVIVTPSGAGFGVGLVVGFGVGFAVGFDVTTTVGVGVMVGDELGEAVAEAVDVAIGAAVRRAVGVAVGEADVSFTVAPETCLWEELDSAAIRDWVVDGAAVPPLAPAPPRAARTEIAPTSTKPTATLPPRDSARHAFEILDEPAPTAAGQKGADPLVREETGAPRDCPHLPHQAAPTAMRLPHLGHIGVTLTSAKPAAWESPGPDWA
jgi:hypothetical protein